MKSKNAKLTLTDIAHEMGAKKLFEDVSAEILGGQVVGLIGPNGVGKSTLINIMAGRIEPRSGTVDVEGEIELVAQGLDADLSVSVYEYIQSRREADNKGPLEEREVDVALSKMRGKEIDIHMPLSTLSGGQRTKVRIAKCLLDNVDILLLDEPTNHLDRDGIAFLQDIVRKFAGPVVIVSHDRQFLEDVCTDIFDLRRGQLEKYEGTYKAYIKERETRAVEQMRAREDQQEKKDKAEKRLEQMRQRSKVHDSTTLGRLIRGRQKLFDRTFVDQKIDIVREDQKMNMEIDGGEDKEKEMMILQKGIVGWVSQDNISDIYIEGGGEMKAVYTDMDIYTSMTGKKELLFQILEQLTIYGQDRIVMIGKNGSGKTTFLRLLQQSGVDEAGSFAKDPVITRGDDIRIGWFSQSDESLVVDERVMAWCLKRFPDGWDQQMITDKLGDANIPVEDLVKRMSELSYGQRVKIRFLQLMLHSYDLLILDEPTNHLDITTREELEIMLQDYKGALFLVSHDRWFVQQIGIVTKWRIREEKIEVLPWTKKYSNKGK